jgi:hypothetical protein
VPGRISALLREIMRLLHQLNVGTSYIWADARREFLHFLRAALRRRARALSFSCALASHWRRRRGRISTGFRRFGVGSPATVIEPLTADAGARRRRAPTTAAAATRRGGWRASLRNAAPAAIGERPWPLAPSARAPAAPILCAGAAFRRRLAVFPAAARKR